ncbi:unnamed protein product [Allacma fusca]|uniref:AH domain-containing protein n=1 Tax=Allacma fusca TaxID=39272 RepID=A0A8J2KY81_9HEXA|nr:unnamed protein product [Allacma fusca]
MESSKKLSWKSRMDRSTLNKVQHQFWVTKQTMYRKLGKKEDDCIVASDAALDAKLELFKSIQLTSSSMNKLLDRYQEKICFLAQEQNAMGRFLKEYGKTDKSGAGKMMVQMGKSLIYCSQQEIALRPPLLRLYQEVDTFRNRAVEDTLGTINSMERLRNEYRASLNWMKNVSQELDPDTMKQMEKFRKVQTHVKQSKAQFDKLKLACLQKVDLLAAARCNMFSHALIQYQNATIKTTGKNTRIYNTLATTFKGYQHFEFSVVKELAEPSKKLAAECGAQEATEDFLFDFNDELSQQKLKDKDKGSTDEGLIRLQESGDPGDIQQRRRQNEEDLLASADASELLENLLGPSGSDQSPETENAQDALNLGLGLFSPQPTSTTNNSKEKGSNSPNSMLSIGSFMSKCSAKELKKDKDHDKDLIGGDLEGLSFENNDTMALLNEILSVSSLQPFTSPQSTASTQDTDSTPAKSDAALVPTAPSSFLPSQLLDFENLDDPGDLLNFNGPPIPTSQKKDDAASTSGPGQAKSWYDIFADLDPIANPDAVGKKETEEIENRYC